MNSKILQDNKTNTVKSINKPEILDSFESTKNIVFKQSKKDTLMTVIKIKNTLEKENMIVY